MGRIVKSGQPCPDCGSSDGLAIYEDGSTYCYSANHQGRKDRQNGQASMTISTRMDSGVSMKEIPTFPIAGLSDRGITEQTAKSFGVRTSYDGNGQPEDYWFPLYKGGTLVGYQSKSALGCGERGAGKVRRHGDTKGTLPFGAHLFEERGKFLIVTEGAEDAMAARQMLLDRGKKWKVVASLGTDSWKRQLEYYENFDAVAIAFDMDEGGQKAAREFASALSPGKARLVEWNPKAKDPNDLLMKGAGGHFIKCINEAKEFQPDGLLVGDDMWSIIKDYKYPEYIPYPPEFEGLNHKMRGMRAGEISMWTAGCVDPDTEYLGRGGWERIADYDGGEVLSYHEDGTAHFEVPAKYTVVEDEGLTHFSTKYGVDQVLSPGHRVVYENNHGALKVAPFYEVAERHENSLCGFSGKFLTTFKTPGTTPFPWSDEELRLQVAVKADGRVVKGGADNYTQMRFRKERKYLRLLDLCRRGGLKHKDNGCRNGEWEVIVWPKDCGKRFNWWHLDHNALAVVVDEVFHWDGSKGKNYYSKHKQDVDFIQYALASQGLRSRVRFEGDVWMLTATRSNKVSITSHPDKKVGMKPYKSPDGKQYCFTVSSGMLVLRRNGCIFITGNTGIGKTAFLRRIKQHIIQNTDWSIGEVELEEMPAITGASMLEFQARKRMAEMTQEEKLKAYKETYGTGRIITLDHRSQYGKGQSLVGKFRHLVHAHGVRAIFLDHITLAVSEYGDGGGGLQQQDRMMADFLAFTEQTGAHLALVSHIRKSPSGSASWAEGAVPTEDDLKGCLDATSEYLSPDGWKRMDEYDGGLVGQWDNGILTFVQADYVKLESSVPMYRFHNANSLDMVVSPEHRMLLSGKVRNAEDVAKSPGRGEIPVHFTKMGEQLPKAYVQLLVAVAADACYHSGGLAKAEFRKPRKIERFRKLLQDNEIEFTESSPARGGVVFRFKALTEYKDLDKCYNWYRACSDTLGTLLEECTFWDGTVSKEGEQVFYTSKRPECDIVQWAAHANGRTARIREYQQGGVPNYHVSISREGSSKNKVMLRGDNCKISRVDSTDGYKYCFKVPSSFFLARHNGRVFVTGNSGSLAQIAFDIIAVSRNKQADDDYERDVSSLHVLKCRREGKTGFADRLYWNNESRSLEQAMEPEQEG